jgi:hypothetical protein
VTGSSSLCPMQTICAWGSLQRGAPIPSIRVADSTKAVEARQRQIGYSVLSRTNRRRYR